MEVCIIRESSLRSYIMADFIETAVSKSAIRILRNPLPSMSALNTIVNGVVSTNPWGCIPYTRSGTSMPPVEITREVYSGKVLYQDPYGKVIGTVTVNAPTQSGFTSAIAEVLGSSDLETSIGGVPAHDPMNDAYSTTLRCCHTNGDLYSVTFTRKQVRLSSYNDDAVINALEVWADAIPQLD
jgi:hypothetical protein